MSSYSDSQNSQEELDKRDEENLKRTPWYCRPEFCICLWAALCAAAILAAIIALALIPVYRQKKNNSTNGGGGGQPQQQQDSVSFLLTYSVNATNVTDLMIGNQTELANRLMDKFDIKDVTVIDIQSTSATATDWDQFARYNISQCQTSSNTTTSILRILFSVPYPAGCYSNSCREIFVEQTRQRIAQSNYRMNLPVTYDDGRTLDVNMNLCLLNQTRADSSNTGTGTQTTTVSPDGTTNINGDGNSTTTNDSNQNTTASTRRTRSTRTTTTPTTTTRTTTSTTTTTRTTTTTTTGTITTTTGTTSTTTDRPCTTTCTPDQTCVRGVCVNIGTLGMALTWSRPGDGDIVLATPNGRTIYWRNRGPSALTDGGNLDRDDQAGTGPENIYWPRTGSAPPTGTYHVCFQPYSFTPPASQANPIQATINVRRPDGSTSPLTRTFTAPVILTNQCTPTSASYMGSMTYP